MYQVVINTLSDDNNKINNEYIRMDKDGKITGVTHVTYIRRESRNARCGSLCEQTADGSPPAVLRFVARDRASSAVRVHG